MFIDIVGIMLTVLLVNLRYWHIVLLLCLIESTLTILISIALESNITEVIAGGIFTTVVSSSNNILLLLLSPVFILLLGIGLQKNKRFSWIDFINPIADFKNPLSTLMIKTALFRMMIILIFSNK